MKVKPATLIAFFSYALWRLRVKISKSNIKKIQKKNGAKLTNYASGEVAWVVKVIISCSHAKRFHTLCGNSCIHFVRHPSGKSYWWKEILWIKHTTLFLVVLFRISLLSCTIISVLIYHISDNWCSFAFLKFLSFLFCWENYEVSDTALLFCTLILPCGCYLPL